MFSRGRVQHAKGGGLFGLGFGFQAKDGYKVRPKRQYLNRVTEWFFNEVDKGMQSPFVIILTFGITGMTAWKLGDRYFKPARELLELRTPTSRIPYADSHNAFWGLRKAVPLAHRAETLGESVETELNRPQLVHSEHSEVYKDHDWVVLELSEYDPQLQDDIYYRSIHCVYVGKDQQKLKPLTEKEQDKFDHETAKQRAVGNVPVSTPTDMYRNPHIHGMAKCKGIASNNNCLTYAGTLSEEISRKLMLVLGPVHLLRDPENLILKWRFTTVKEAPVKTLVLGMKSGELSRWLAAAFPNFDVDVIERDGGLVKLARKYFGFRETSSLKLYIADPQDYVRKLASQEIDKRYNLVLIDGVDGHNRLDNRYGRLEFIHHVRNGMEKNGIVAMNIPNRDPQFIYNVVQNWRMAFHLRTVLLIHCTTTENTVMMAFQDSADRGKPNFGGVSSVDEFKDVIQTHASYYGNNRIVTFDLAKELTRQNFRILNAGKEYPIEHYLPVHHPLVLERAGGKVGSGEDAIARANKSLFTRFTNWVGLGGAAKESLHMKPEGAR